MLAQSTPAPLNPCPEAHKGVHGWVWYAANVLAKAGVDPTEAVECITRRMTRAPGPHNEVTAAVARAYRLKAQAPPAAQWNGMRVEKPRFCPNKLKRIAARMDGVDKHWLASRSPIRVDNRTPASFLHQIFRKGEHVLIFDRYQSQGQALWTHRGFPYDARTLDKFRACAPDGVWFLSNPCDGLFHNIRRLADPEFNPTGRSRRAEENLTDYRHLLIESDEVDPGLWLAALVQIPLPILSITTSGGRSVHALVRTDCHSKSEWADRIEKHWKPKLIRLGACQSSTSAVRLTRLPCCRRESKGNLQQLLYLNPNPDFTPICELPEFIQPLYAKNPRTATYPDTPHGCQ